LDVARAYGLLRSALRDGLLPPTAPATGGAPTTAQWADWLALPPEAVEAALELLTRHLVLREGGGTRLSRVGLTGPRDLAELLPREGAAGFTEPVVSVARSTALLRSRLGADVDTVVMVTQRADVGGEPAFYRASYHPLGEQPEGAPRGEDAVVDAERERALFDAERLGGLEAAFLEIFGVELGEIAIAFEALRMDTGLSRELGVQLNDVVLLREMLLHDVSGRPRSLTYTHFRSDRVAVERVR
jgi:GntR family transcriptional regulator